MVHVEHGIRPPQAKDTTTVAPDRSFKPTPIRSGLDLLTQPGIRDAVGKDHVTGVRVPKRELIEHGKALGRGRIYPKDAPRRP